MTLIQKSKVKRLLNDLGVRVNPDAFDGINRIVESALTQLSGKVREDGMKTVMPHHAAPNVNGAATQTGCKECVNIKPEFIRFARSTQDYCHEQAIILSRKVNA